MKTKEENKVPEQLIPYIATICTTLKNAIIPDDDKIKNMLLDKLMLAAVTSIVLGRSVPMQAEIKFDEEGNMIGFYLGGDFAEHLQDKTPEEIWSALSKSIFAFDKKKRDLKGRFGFLESVLREIAERDDDEDDSEEEESTFGDIETETKKDGE